MIYITGDTHGDFSRFEEEKFPMQLNMTKKMIMWLFVETFGGVWSFEKESYIEKMKLDSLNDRNFTTLFVDGNHENFTRLYNYPVEN